MGYQNKRAFPGSGMDKYFSANKDLYHSGVIPIRDNFKTGGRVGFKEGSDDKWIQKATASIKKRGTEGVCTGKKFGSKSCPPGSKRYNLAKTFRAMNKKG